jgi:rod shape determining protein RodA
MSREYVNQMPTMSRRSGILDNFRIDIPLLLLLLILCGFGLVVLYSASGKDMGSVIKQAEFYAMGFFVMFVVAQLNPGRLRYWAIPGYFIGLLLLIAVLFLGDSAKGAQRWLQIGSFRFQPSEIMKLILPMVVAWYFSTRPSPPRFVHILVGLIIVGIPAVLVARQPDLGTAILVSVSGVFIIFFAGLSLTYIFTAIGILVAAAWPMWHYGMHEYQQQRILTMFDPESDKLGTGWNIIQSKTAIGSGGFDGKGWLLGTQSHLDFLPESHTDFIIAVLAEEYGFKGVLFLLTIYTLIIARCAWISVNANYSFGRLLAGSLVCTFFVYVFVNMGMVSGILPIVGVPLPLVSQGGTSAITLLTSFGLLMAISGDKRILLR